MSSYYRETKHPRTGQWELASWVDNLFGLHRYGVIFPSDVQGTPPPGPLKTAFDPYKVSLEVRDPLAAAPDTKREVGG